MSFLNWLQSEPPQPAHPMTGHTGAERILRGLNPHALRGWEGHEIVFIEDHADSDGRLYRLEYRSNPEGTRATAWCRFKPWPHKSYSIHQCHLHSSAEICLGNRTHNLHDAVLRARYWCTAYSYLREHGTWLG